MKMNKITNVFDEMTSFEALDAAYRRARKQKRYRDEVLAFSADLDSNLHSISDTARSGDFVFGPYDRHWVYVPKRRMVMALPFRARVLQWSIYQTLNPYFDRRMIEGSYACRDGKGALKAALRLQYWMQYARHTGGDWYVVKGDVSKFFYRADHAVLVNILASHIDDDRLMDLLCKVIAADGECFGLPRWTSPEEIEESGWLPDVGMPIGNLTSQLFANVYLDMLDHFVKHRLHTHCYCRYMDDNIALIRGKENARWYLDETRGYLLDALHLDLNDKTGIRPLDDRGVEFVGYIVSADRLRLRKATVRRMKSSYRAICRHYFTGKMDHRSFVRRTNSYKGLLMHCDAGNLKNRLNQIYLTAKEAAYG